jgi:hypothetical protein
MQTEYEFTLPKGLPNGDGTVYRDGVMRLATARDEIEPLGDPAVRRNDAYLTVLLLSRVVTRIGAVTDITTHLIEGLYAADFDHLQRLYERLNTAGDAVGVVACPHCQEEFEVDLSEIRDGPSGEA